MRDNFSNSMTRGRTGLVSGTYQTGLAEVVFSFDVSCSVPIVPVLLTEIKIFGLRDQLDVETVKQLN